MAEHEYEYDEWGGHKDMLDEDGVHVSPGLGCKAGCPAAFYTPQALKAHMSTMHPTASSAHTGFSPEEIKLARIRPEIASHLGISEEELWAPQNAQEFEEHQHIADVLSTQEKSRHIYENTPVHHAVQETLSHVRMWQALAGQRGADPERLDEVYDHIQHHLTQAGHGYTTGVQVYDEPFDHILEAQRHMDNLGRAAGLPTGEVERHINHILRAKYGNNPDAFIDVPEDRPSASNETLSSLKDKLTAHFGADLPTQSSSRPSRASIDQVEQLKHHVNQFVGKARRAGLDEETTNLVNRIHPQIIHHLNTAANSGSDSNAWQQHMAQAHDYIDHMGWQVNDITHGELQDEHDALSDHISRMY